MLAEGGTLCYTQLMQPEELLFKEAMEAIDKKEIAKAREIMTRLLQRNRSNADYWVWMSALVETVKEREFCLREAQKINPAHPMVVQGLRWLGEPIEDSNPPPPIDAEKLKWKTTLEAEVQPTRPASRPKTRLSSWIALGVTITALVVALIFIARSPRFRPDTASAAACGRRGRKCRQCRRQGAIRRHAGPPSNLGIRPRRVGCSS